MKSGFNFMAPFLAASLPALCAAGAAPPDVHLKTPDLPVVLVNLFKMFFTAGWRGPLAMATSPDLKTWTRPELGLHGGNILLPEGASWGTGEGSTAGTDNALWYDIGATDPKERIKFLTCWMHAPKEQRVTGLTHSLQVSDGVTWSKPVPCNASAGDCSSIFYNPFRNKWVQRIKQDGPRGRCRYYVESERFLDGADWSKSVYWTNADRLDRPEPAGACPGYEGEGDPPQLYSLAAVAYESLMIGMHQIHRGPKNEICAKGKFPKLTSGKAPRHLEDHLRRQYEAARRVARPGRSGRQACQVPLPCHPGLAVCLFGDAG